VPGTAAPSSLRSALKTVACHRGAQTALVLWIAGSLVSLWLARGSLPFDRPAVAGLPFLFQMVAPSLGMIQIFLLMLVVFMLTRKRSVPDIANRAPERRVALRQDPEAGGDFDQRK
jgi:hypothetical protein